MIILNVEASFDTSEGMYLVKIGNSISTFSDYLDAKDFIDTKTRRVFWKFEEKLKSAANAPGNTH